MKLRFKHQKFQTDAAKAVVDVFSGQPYLTPSYIMDKGSGYIQQSLTDEEDFTGWSNHKIVTTSNICAPLLTWLENRFEIILQTKSVVSICIVAPHQR